MTDAVDSLILAAKSKFSNKIYNVGSGNTVTINKIEKLLGVKKIIYIPKRPGEPDCPHADIPKAKKFLSWKPKVTLEKGLNVVIKNINYWKDAPLWTPKKIKLATKDRFKYIKK